MSDRWVIGVIGGSGLYNIDAIEDAQWIGVNSPFGQPSDEILFGRIGGIEFRFLPRHGRGHRVAPSDLNARANVDALKRAGCTDLLAISAVGSLREEIEPGRFVVVDQFIDRTQGREASFFGTGMVAHVSMADPVCERMAALAAGAFHAAGGKVAQGGTYLAMEGPQFSTRAESHLYRQWGADVIGMTALPEAKLAREAELPYALVGMATDYDCWRSDEETVDVATVIAQVQANGQVARDAVVRFAASLPETRTPSPIDRALDNAIITAPAARDPAVIARLDAVMRRLLAAG